MLRVFIGVSPSTTILRKIEEFKDKYKTTLKARWLDSNNIHITLQFIGWVKEKDISTILENIQKSIQGIQPFSISYQYVGAFPERGTPRILWVGIENNGQLQNLASKLSKVNKPFIKGGQRGFTPHLTIARLKHVEKQAVSDIIEGNKNANFGEDYVQKIILFESKLFKTGSKYSVLRTFQLGS